MEKRRVERFPILLHMLAPKDSHIAQVDGDLTSASGNTPVVAQGILKRVKSGLTVIPESSVGLSSPWSVNTDKSANLSKLSSPVN